MRAPYYEVTVDPYGKWRVDINEGDHVRLLDKGEVAPQGSPDPRGRAKGVVAEVIRHHKRERREEAERKKGIEHYKVRY